MKNIYCLEIHKGQSGFFKKFIYTPVLALDTTKNSE